MPAKCKVNRQKKRCRIYLRDMGICQLCKLFVEFNEMSLDHKFPRSKGGRKDEDNLQVAHKFCNVIKGNSLDNLTPEYFLSHKDYGKENIHHSEFIH